MGFASTLLNVSRLIGCSFLFLLWASPLSATPLDDLLSTVMEDEAQAVQKALALNKSQSKYHLNTTDLQAFYQVREFRPTWLTKKTTDNKNLSTFIDSLKAFGEYHGLPESDYPAVEMQRLLASPLAEDAITLDLLISDRLIKIAHDLNGDRVNLGLLYVGWDFTKPPRHVVTEFAEAIQNNKVDDYISSLSPTGFDYTRLADSLKVYREIKNHGGWPFIPSGQTIKLGMDDPRIALIKQRLAAEGYDLSPDLQPEDTHYTEALEQTVIAYQARNGLKGDGNLGKNTIRAMSITVDQRINQILANMERIRHLPRDLPNRYALVNIADTSVKVIENGQVIYHAPVVAGRTDRKTPFIQSFIRSVIFNPSWHVPSKIAREDILPKLRKDSHYLEKHRMVIKEGDGTDPHGTLIDWKRISAAEFTYRLRQEPGATNALGRIKFDFDNDFSVYMHGTPHEELFAKARRHLSSGCVRLQDPVTFATIVLQGNSGNWDKNKVEKEVRLAKTHWLTLEEPLPLYFIYQTATFPTPEGPIHFSPDDYNYDQILTDALREAERK
ncbi:MAG: L,D-transpeptidase family protein [Alphaproteobacteria bacterium]|nr:L,D-transpeptidase family protein [Alphaproteobacteria bacterium]